MIAPRRAAYRYLLLLLFAGYGLGYADRTVFALVLKPIQVSLALSDGQAGLLSGAAFALTYALFAPVGGLFVDRFRRKYLFAFAVAFWSFGCLGCGFAASPLTMGLCRAAVGAGEALVVPLAVSLFGDAVPREGRARALAIFFSAGSIGSLAVNLTGGVLLHRFAHHPLTLAGSPVLPWRSLFFLLSLPGFALSAVILFSLREPARTALPPAEGTRVTVGSWIGANRTLGFTLFLGYPLLQIGAVALTAWTFIFFDRIHNMPADRAGVLVGLTAGLTALVGCLLGGPAITFFRRRGFADASLRACLAGGVLFTLCACVGLLIPSLFASMVLFALAFLFCYIPTVGAFSAISEVAPPSIRAGIAGINSLTLGLVTSSLGPYLVGLASDHLFPTQHGIRPALLLVTLVTACAGGLIVITGFKPFRALLAATPPERLAREEDATASATV